MNSDQMNWMVSFIMYMGVELHSNQFTILCAVVVFNLLEPGNISKALCGEQVGTLIDQTGRIS